MSGGKGARGMTVLACFYKKSTPTTHKPAAPASGGHKTTPKSPPCTIPLLGGVGVGKCVQKEGAGLAHQLGDDRSRRVAWLPQKTTPSTHKPAAPPASGGQGRKSPLCGGYE